MKRGRRKTKEEYIKIRIKQLAEDRKNASYDYDKQWYSRLIQELQWVLQND
jgi:hypothetical protein